MEAQIKIAPPGDGLQLLEHAVRCLDRRRPARPGPQDDARWSRRTVFLHVQDALSTIGKGEPCYPRAPLPVRARLEANALVPILDSVGVPRAAPGDIAQDERHPVAGIVWDPNRRPGMALDNNGKFELKIRFLVGSPSRMCEVVHVETKIAHNDRVLAPPRM
jgi:hypothetical protein